MTVIQSSILSKSNNLNSLKSFNIQTDLFYFSNFIFCHFINIDQLWYASEENCFPILFKLGGGGTRP